MLYITKQMIFFFVENQNKGDNESENENPNRHSEYGQTKHYQQTLSSIDSFLLSLVISFVGSSFNLLRSLGIQI